MKGTYAQVGVVLGDVRYFDLEGAPQAVESINGEDNDFEALASLTADAPPGVNLIFVREIVDTKNPLGGLGIILGVAGGIPGPAGLQGSGRSAVIVSLDEPPDQPGAPEVELGHTMAHEAGHYLGLFHSSELFGQAHDPLDDTKLNDQDNLMYFSSAGSTLSPDQGFVIRNNPWVRPEFVP